MKMFREQIGTVSNWFDRWTPCEQTVVMVALLRRLQPTQARFLSTVLHRQFWDCEEVRRDEVLANDSNFVASLANGESKETLIRELLTYLPLLSPKNADVKSIYLALISKVLKYTLDHCALAEEARHLLSYSLIHPAFSAEDRRFFSNWLREFEEKLNSAQTVSNNEGLTAHYTSSLSGSPPSMHDFGNSWQPNTSPSSNNAGSLSGSPAPQSGLSVTNFTNIQRIRRSNSLTPPVLHSDTWNSQEEFCSAAKPRSLSLSSEVSPQSSLPSSGSGSESHLADQRPTFTSPGMRDTHSWLKSLRLHKYSILFAHLTFDEMMSLDEKWLDNQGVTKGARHKIILCLGKLKERPHQLKQMYNEMTNDRDSLRNALTEIKWMLTTPIKPATGDDEGSHDSSSGGTGNNNPPGAIGSNRFQQQDDNNPDQQRNREADDELPGIIVKVIGKACELNPDLECEGLLVSILDKCLSHESFSQKQKRVLSLWRQQQAPIARRNSSGHHPHFHNHHHRTSSSLGSNNGNGSKPSRHFSPRVLNLSSHLGTGGLGSAAPSWSAAGNSIHAMFMAKRPSLQDSLLESARSHLSVQRTKSAPLPNFFASLSSPPPMFDPLISLGQQTSDILSGLNFGTDPSSLIVGGLTSSTGNSGSNTQQMSGVSGQQSSAMDITSRLESLCLSMTEAALGPAFNSY